MPGIYLYTGNRLELLADKLAEILASEPLPPLEKEIILVQSRGMARWLALETANRLSIWANCECPFPNTFIHEIYRSIMPDIAYTSSYDKDFITWHLLDIFPSLQENPDFSNVKNYIETGDGLKSYQFAREVADLFDQYTLYRPDMLLDWENDMNTAPVEQSWQALLWVSLVERLQNNMDKPGSHRARLLKSFQERIFDPGFNRNILPARITVFGISSLPPYHLKVLAGLAHHIDVHLFVMNPCLEFWFDIVADRDIVKISRSKDATQDMLHLEHGNSLLSSMGHLGRDFLAMVQDLESHNQEFFQAPGTGSLLCRIQEDILNLEGESTTKKTISRNDYSIIFQSCHSPMREVEILHDHLLGFFDGTEESEIIEPRDILVMAPDINEYAPLIRAVFDAADGSGPKLPFTIADQSIKKTSTYVDTFFEILSLFRSRFTSIDVFGILRAEPVRNKFSISDHELSILEKWIDETRICWGLDQDHKKNINLPDFLENTWRAGLDRLMLGYAMEGQNRIFFQNILPYDNMEGSDTVLLGSFMDFAESLYNLAEVMLQNHTLAEWSEILLDIKEKFLLANEAEDQDDILLQRVLFGLRELQAQTTFHKQVPLDVMRSYLLDALEQRHSDIAGAAGFLSGSVTFCSMLPMRAIPFKIICLLGMNDGLYPRPGRRRSFDLMAQATRRGDRSRRHDDRYLFLETILSTRKTLYISFEGQSVKDNSSKPPSVLVSELMDYIEQRYELEPKNGSTGNLVEHLTTFNRLQPFHPNYFSLPQEKTQLGLFSYSLENCQGAGALTSNHSKALPVVPVPLPTPPDTYKEISLVQLISFFSHPARYLLSKRIGMAPIEEIKSLNTSEPFAIKGLDRYKLENDILECFLAGNDPDSLYPVKKAEGLLPHGEIGKIQFIQMVQEVQKFKRTLDTLLPQEKIPDQEFTLKLKDFRITGRLDNLTGNGMIRYRYATVKPKDIIRCWISHLVLNSLTWTDRNQMKMTTHLAGKDRTYTYKEVANAPLYLEEILALYWQGLIEPLHFFPRSSYVYARTLNKGKGEQQALLKAQDEWDGNAYAAGEKYDPYNNFCFRNLTLPDSPFADQAEKFFLPVFEYQS